jgi:metal-sulfur cluster biosynthetic enzyme
MSLDGTKSGEELTVTKEDVIEALKLVEDPDLFLDIWFLGLIYDIDIDEGIVNIEMTFTSPMCPSGPHLITSVKDRVSELSGVKEVNVNIVFSPPWVPSDEVKLTLGLI